MKPAVHTEPMHFDDEVLSLDAQPIGDVYTHPLVEFYDGQPPGTWLAYPEVREAQIWESITVRSMLTKLPPPVGRN